MNLNKNFKSGFTLIELLVVVAIIGILASVVLASLSGARNRGTDAKIKSQLAAMRGQAELYTGTGTAQAVATPCPRAANTLFDTANNGLGNLFNDLTMANTRCISAAGVPSVSVVAWAAAVQLASGGTAGDTIPDSWCVDSTGVSRSYTWGPSGSINNSINGNVCP